jgi:hypothetical protein
MMPIDNFGIGRGERFFPDKEMEHMPEHVDSQVWHAGTHGDHAEIGRLRNQGRDQRFVELLGSGLMALERGKVLTELGELVNLQQ